MSWRRRRWLLVSCVTADTLNQFQIATVCDDILLWFRGTIRHPPNFPIRPTSSTPSFSGILSVEIKAIASNTNNVASKKENCSNLLPYQSWLLRLTTIATHFLAKCCCPLRHEHVVNARHDAASKLTAWPDAKQKKVVFVQTRITPNFAWIFCVFSSQAFFVRRCRPLGPIIGAVMVALLIAP